MSDAKPHKSPKKTKKRIPAYQRIKDAILHNIHTGMWQAGDTIPTEHALAKKFNVSRMTVNRALKELSEDQVLYRRQGSGTFVAQQQFNHTYVEVRNIAEDIKLTNKRYRAQVISQRRFVSDDISKALVKYFSQPMLTDTTRQRNLKTRKAAKKKDVSAIDAHPIDKVKIIHFANDIPVQMEERWVNAEIVPDFHKQDFNTVNTSDYLIQQAPLEGGSYTIRAVPAPKEVATALKINEGEPALLLSRQTYSNGQVVTFVNMWHAGHDYQFSGTL